MMLYKKSKRKFTCIIRCFENSFITVTSNVVLIVDMESGNMGANSSINNTRRQKIEIAKAEYRSTFRQCLEYHGPNFFNQSSIYIN